MAAPKFNVRIAGKIIRAKRKGATNRDAAEQAGITDRTLRYWLAVGESPERAEPLAAFARAFREAEDQHRRDYVAEQVAQLTAVA